MTEKCVKNSIPSPTDMHQERARSQGIVRVSIVGILVNVLLTVFKAVVGMMTGSIAIVMDAINNLSDATSSLITILGTKMAQRQPDRGHPFGHGRMEYLSAMVIAIVILYAGITSLVESVKHILQPVRPDYTAAALWILAAAVLVKIVLGLYTGKRGKKLHSESLVNSGKDAQFDAVISASTLAAAGIFLTTGVSLEAWLGAAIALVIIQSGLGMLGHAVSDILGTAANADLLHDIETYVSGFDKVEGVYDLALNDIGPESYAGSLHVAVPSTMTIDEFDILSREIMSGVYHKFHVIITAVGVYSVDDDDPEVLKLKEQVEKIVMADPYVLQMHGFHIDREKKTLRFDAVISFDAPDPGKEHYQILQSVQRAFPDYQVMSSLDRELGNTQN